MSRLNRAEVLNNIPLTDREFILRLKLPPGSLSPMPGQFYLLRATNTFDPLLRRPFSAFRWSDEWVDFLISEKGKGTLVLKSLRPGDEIDLLGPAGNYFPPPSGDMKLLVVAGGIGIASVFSILREYNGDSVLFYGARSSDALLIRKDIEDFSGEVVLCTDDGSIGFKGSVVERLRLYINERTPEKAIVYACGPEAMITALKTYMKETGLRGYISLEERMACGVGACMGCVKNTSEGMKRVCIEGPVFPVEVL